MIVSSKVQILCYKVICHSYTIQYVASGCDWLNNLTLADIYLDPAATASGVHM